MPENLQDLAWQVRMHYEIRQIRAQSKDYQRRNFDRSYEGSGFISCIWINPPLADLTASLSSSNKLVFSTGMPPI